MSEFSSTQFHISDADFDQGQSSPLSKLKELADSIADSDLAADGREENFHITVKYGLHTEDPEEVKQVIREWLSDNPNKQPVTAILDKVSVFPAEENGSQKDEDLYDVVKVNVLSDDLHSLNQFLSNRLEHTDTHPKYQPHITLAYTKPGAGSKYTNGDMDRQLVQLDKLIFSDKDHNHTAIDLKQELQNLDTNGSVQNKHNLFGLDQITDRPRPPQESLESYRFESPQHEYKNCPLCGGRTKKLKDQPGWRCNSPPCEWSMTQAGDQDMDMERRPKPVIQDQEPWERASKRVTCPDGAPIPVALGTCVGHSNPPLGEGIDDLHLTTRGPMVGLAAKSQNDLPPGLVDFLTSDVREGSDGLAPGMSEFFAQRCPDNSLMPLGVGTCSGREGWLDLPDEKDRLNETLYSGVKANWEETKHPRGQPENAGQFGSGGGGNSGEVNDSKPQTDIKPQQSKPQTQKESNTWIQPGDEEIASHLGSTPEQLGPEGMELRRKTSNKALPNQSRPELDETELDCIDKYSSALGFFSKINYSLRNGVNTDPSTQKIIDGLRSAFNKCKPFDEPVTVTRGIHLEPGSKEENELLGKLKESLDNNTPFLLKGFTSTTTHSMKQGGESYGSVKFAIKAKFGLDLKPISRHPVELELLLGENSTFKVTDIKKDDYGYSIAIEQLNDGQPPPTPTAAPKEEPKRSGFFNWLFGKKSLTTSKQQDNKFVDSDDSAFYFFESQEEHNNYRGFLADGGKKRETQTCPDGSAKPIGIGTCAGREGPTGFHDEENTYASIEGVNPYDKNRKAMSWLAEGSGGALVPEPEWGGPKPKKKSLENPIKILQDVVDNLTDDKLSGIGVWVNTDQPHLVIVDIMDWGDPKVGEKIGKVAQKVVGEKHVVYHNEGGTPQGNWIEVKKSRQNKQLTVNRLKALRLSYSCKALSTESRHPTIAVDFDGTIANLATSGSNPTPIETLQPRPRVREALREFTELGWRVIIFTVRDDYAAIKKWMRDHSLPFDYINENPDQPTSSPKVIADVYIDDRAIDARDNWDEVLKEVLDRVKTLHTVITGHSGVGKTTLANMLSEATKTPVHKLDKDPLWTANRPLADHPDRFTQGTPVQRRYHELLGRLCRRALSLSDPHILEGCQFLSHPELLEGHKVVLVDAPEDVIVSQRLRRDEGDGKLDRDGQEVREAKAEELYHRLEPLVEKIKALQDVEVIQPNEMEKWVQGNSNDRLKFYSTKAIKQDKDSAGREYCWDTDQGGKRVDCSTSNSGPTPSHTTSDKVPKKTPPVKPPANQKDILSKVLRSAQSRDLEDNMRELSGTNLYDILDKSRVGDNILSQFSAHGTNSLSSLTQLLNGGVDASKQFHSEVLSSKGYRLLRDNSSFVVVSHPQQTFEQGGIPVVFVDKLHEPNIADLKQAFPGVHFFPATQAPELLTKAGSTTGNITEQSRDKPKNKPVPLSQKPTPPRSKSNTAEQDQFNLRPFDPSRNNKAPWQMTVDEFVNNPDILTFNTGQQGSKEKGSFYVFANGQTVRVKTPHMGHETSDVGLKKGSLITYFVDPKDATEVGWWQASSAPSKRVIVKDGYLILTSLNAKTNERGIDKRLKIASEAPKNGLSPVEFFEKSNLGSNVYKGSHPGSPIQGLRKPTKEDYTTLVSAAQTKSSGKKLSKSFKLPRVKSGFTGQKEDALGRTNCFVEGEHKPCNHPDVLEVEKTRTPQEAEADASRRQSEQQQVAVAGTNPYQTPTPPQVHPPEKVLESLKNKSFLTMDRLEGGVSSSFLVTLEDATKAVYKPALGEKQSRQGVKVGTHWRREVATYEVANILKMEDLVPPTVSRASSENPPGSVQEYINNAETPLESTDIYDGEKDAVRSAVLDYIVGHLDRHYGNWLLKDGKIRLIDNGLAFPSKYEKVDFINIRILEHASEKDFTVPEELGFSESDWPKVEESLRKSGLGNSAIELTQVRFHSLLRHKGKKFSDLPGFFGNKLSDMVQDSLDMKREVVKRWRKHRNDEKRRLRQTPLQLEGTS